MIDLKKVNWEKLKNPSPYFSIFNHSVEKVTYVKQRLYKDYLNMSDETRNYSVINSISNAYFYATAYPVPDNWADLALPEGAYWHTEGWTGAILPYAAVVASEQPLELLLEYLRSLQAHGARLMG